MSLSIVPLSQWDEEHVARECIPLPKRGLGLLERVYKKLSKFPHEERLVRAIVPTVHMAYVTMSHRGYFDPATKNVRVSSDYEGCYAAVGILLHELIHAIGGTELDAEFFENECCSAKFGAELPCCGDFDKFRVDGSRLGLKMVWRGADEVTVIYQREDIVIRRTFRK